MNIDLEARWDGLYICVKVAENPIASLKRAHQQIRIAHAHSTGEWIDDPAKLEEILDWYLKQQPWNKSGSAENEGT